MFFARYAIGGLAPDGRIIYTRYLAVILAAQYATRYHEFQAAPWNPAKIAVDRLCFFTAIDAPALTAVNVPEAFVVALQECVWVFAVRIWAERRWMTLHIFLRLVPRNNGCLCLFYRGSLARYGFRRVPENSFEPVCASLLEAIEQCQFIAVRL